MTLLEPGKTYIYTVQARDLSGRLRFRNNGVSPPETFTYAAPTAVLDELCYVPDNLSILKGERLRWVGQDFVDVQYTVTVRELPEERFVSLSELAPTPTFPDRRPYNGGPQVQYGYDLPVPLDTTGGRAFRVKLCAVCPQTGEENCGEVIFGTPREVVPTETIPGDDIVVDTVL